MKNEDIDLIERTLAGDETAFTELVKKYEKPVHALAWRKIGDFHIAEDITQDTFLKAYQRLHTLKDPHRFAGWLYVIATRRCLAWFRKERIQVQPLADMDSVSIQRDAYSQHIATERAKTAKRVQQEVVKKLLMKLKESDRTILTLHYFGEMTCEEMSEFLGVSVNTIKSRLRRARNRLKKEETVIREALDTFKISPNLTDNIIREVSRLKPGAPSGSSKPLVPWVIGVSSAVLIVLLLGIGSHYLSRFQQPYSLDAQAEMKIDIIDAPVVFDLEAKPDTRNRIGELSNAPGRDSSISPKPDATLFTAAQTDEAEEKTDAKQQWIQVNAPSASGPVWSLSATPEGEIYAVLDYAGICKLASDGETWQLLTPMKDGGYSSTAHIGKWNDTLYFTPGDKLLASTDEGKTWHSMASPVRQGSGYPNFVFTDETFYLRVGSEVFYSDDIGKSWQKISIGDNGWYSSIQHLVAIKNTLFVGANTREELGIYRLDGDRTKYLQLPVATGLGSIESILTAENTLYVLVAYRGTANENVKRQINQKQERAWWIFRSTDMGDSWTDITPANAWALVGTPPVLTLVAVGDTVLAIGKHDVSVARSVNKGETWAYEKNTGISRKISGSVTPMHAVALNERTFFVGGTIGIHRSTDGGKSWHRFNTGLRSRVDKLFAFSGKSSVQKHPFPTLYAITENNYGAGDLVKSIDAGTSWETVDIAVPILESDRNLPHQEIYPPRIITIAESGGVLYAKGEAYPKSYKTLMYRISDDGNKLTPLEGMPAFNSKTLYDELEKLQKAVRDVSIKWPPDKAFIEHLQKNYVGSSGFMKAVAMAPSSELLQRGLQGTFAVSGDTFYMEYNYKLFRWKRGEKEWYDTGIEETVELGGKKHIKLVIAVSRETVYVGTRDGDLIQSIDGGDTWKNVTPQFLANLKSPLYKKAIRDIIFVGSTVYVATRDGVISSNDGENWRAITDAAGERLAMTQLAASGTTLYGITMTNNLYRLESESGAWKQVAPELLNTVTSLVIDGNTLYVGTGDLGVFRLNLK